MGGVSIAAGEVHTHCEVDLTATHDVIEKRVHSSDLVGMYACVLLCRIVLCMTHISVVCIARYYGMRVA